MTDGMRRPEHVVRDVEVVLGALEELIRELPGSTIRRDALAAANLVRTHTARATAAIRRLDPT